MSSLFTVIVAAVACFITFAVARRVFQDHLKLGPPGVLAAAVAGLAFLGLTSHGQGMVTVLLLPYAALALTLLLLFLLFGLSVWLRKTARGRGTFDSLVPKRGKPDRHQIVEVTRAGICDPQKRPTGLRVPPPPKSAGGRVSCSRRSARPAMKSVP
jgi:protein-S-isoprenylcysteine O-methyltransferase Ste14